MKDNYLRMLQLLEGIRQPVAVPTGSAGLYTEIVRDQLHLVFAAKVEGQVHRARLSTRLSGDEQIRIEDLTGTQPLLDSQTPNPFSGQGISTFLVNTLLETLGNVLPEYTVLSGRLKAPQSVTFEPLAARRNFWRRFGFEIESWGEGKERVVGTLGTLNAYPDQLLGGPAQEGVDLLHLHLVS